jgi:hypothetical protein
MTSTIMSIPHLPSIWQPLFQGWADACLRLAPVGLGTAKEARAMPIAIPTWINRIWQEYRAGNLTRAARDVLLTLHTYRGHGGVAWPSQVTLGERANCDERTVRRALVAAQGLDLVRWTERRVRAGWRWLRTSNLYRFVVPEGPVQPTRRALRQVAVTTGHCDREGRIRRKKRLSTKCYGRQRRPLTCSLPGAWPGTREDCSRRGAGERHPLDAIVFATQDGRRSETLPHGGHTDGRGWRYSLRTRWMTTCRHRARSPARATGCTSGARRANTPRTPISPR